MSYVGSATLYIKGGGSARVFKVFVSLKGSMLRACNAILASTEEIHETGLQVDIWKSELSSQLNGLFNSDGVHNMLEWKYCHCTNELFPFICAFAEKATGYMEEGEPRKMSRLYSELVVEMYWRHHSGQLNVNK